LGGKWYTSSKTPINPSKKRLAQEWKRPRCYEGWEKFVRSHLVLRKIQGISPPRPLKRGKKRRNHNTPSSLGGTTHPLSIKGHGLFHAERGDTLKERK